MIFTEPQVAAVGHTLAGAREAGLERASRSTARSAGTPAAASSGAARRATRGSWSIEDRGVIVGATFTGVEVAESLHAATIAVVAEVPIARLATRCPCFPTRSEVWLNLARGLSSR